MFFLGGDELDRFLCLSLEYAAREIGFLRKQLFVNPMVLIVAIVLPSYLTTTTIN